MKTTIKNMFHTLLAVVCLSIFGCEDESIDLNQTQTGNPTKVSLAGGGSLIKIGADTSLYTKDTEKLVVPMRITLAAPAAKAFRVALKVDSAKLDALVKAGGELAGVKVMERRFYSIPQDIAIPMGSKTADFELTINLSTLEFDYQKQQAVLVSILDPTKGNSVDEGKSYVVAVYDPAAILKPEAIRKVSFVLGGTTEFIPKNKARDNYKQVQQQELAVPVKISLSGVATKFVDITIVRDKQYEQQMIQSDPALKGAIQLDSTEYYMLNNAQLGNLKNDITLSLQIRTFKFSQNYFNKRVVAFTINSVSRHQIDQTKKTVLFVFDPQYLMDLDLSYLIKNNQTPMKWSVRENNNTGRWGILQDWTVNDAVKNRNQGMGGWATDSGESMTVEAWGEGEPNIINGKLYQTINLEPATYKLRYENGYQNLFDQTYVLAIAGSTFPNVADVPSSALGFIQMENCNCGGKSGEFLFTVPQSGPVSVGVATTIVKNEQKFELKKFILVVPRKEFL